MRLEQITISMIIDTCSIQWNYTWYTSIQHFFNLFSVKICKNLASGLRSNLFATKAIIPYNNMHNFKVFNSRQHLKFIFRKLPSIQRFKPIKTLTKVPLDLLVPTWVVRTWYGKFLLAAEGRVKTWKRDFSQINSCNDKDFRQGLK